jgi:hypothetical protein
MRPFWMTWRAVLTDFDFREIYSILGDSKTPNQNSMGFWAFGMLWVFTFFVTIILMNLMIAQMSQAYERIEKQSKIYRKYSIVERIREYKDKRSPVPPPFIIFRSLRTLTINFLGGRCCQAKPSDENTETEMGFSDYMWLSRTESLLKRERMYQKEYLNKLHAEEENESRLDRAAFDAHELRGQLDRNHEVLMGRFERLEKEVKYMKGGAPKASNESTGAPLGRPAFVSPARLNPINYVQDAYTKGAHHTYPPTSARPRHEALQPRPAAMYAGGGAEGAAGTPTLAAVRESHAYLSSVSQLPLTSHRSAPRLSQPRSAATAQADMLLMDSARRVFDLYDRDRSGDIDARELQPALRDLGLVNIDGAQAAAILSKYDADKSAKLDFVEFTQLLHELREFQVAANRAAQDATRAGPAASITVAGGGMGSGYYSVEQIRGLQEAAARQALQSERARLEGRAQLASADDAGPRP